MYPYKYIRFFAWHGNSYLLCSLHSWIRTRTTSKELSNLLSNLKLGFIVYFLNTRKKKSPFTKFFLGTTVTYSYADACRNIFNTIKTSGHSSLEKYTSHFIWKGLKGLRNVLCMRGELETEQNCNILTPPTLLATAGFLSYSPGLLSRGPGGPASAGTWFSFQHLLSNWSELPAAPGYIIIWCPPTSCERHICTQFNLSTVKVIPWYLRPDTPVIYTGAFLIWQPGRVGGQYVTVLNFIDGDAKCFFIMLPELNLIFRLKKGSNNKYFLTISPSTQQKPLVSGWYFVTLLQSARHWIWDIWKIISLRNQFFLLFLKESLQCSIQKLYFRPPPQKKTTWKIEWNIALNNF